MSALWTVLAVAIVLIVALAWLLVGAMLEADELREDVRRAERERDEWQAKYARLTAKLMQAAGKREGAA